MTPRLSYECDFIVQLRSNKKQQKQIYVLLTFMMSCSICWKLSKGVSRVNEVASKSYLSYIVFDKMSSDIHVFCSLYLFVNIVFTVICFDVERFSFTLRFIRIAVALAGKNKNQIQMFLLFCRPPPMPLSCFHGGCYLDNVHLVFDKDVCTALKFSLILESKHSLKERLLYTVNRTTWVQFSKNYSKIVYFVLFCVYFNNI